MSGIIDTMRIAKRASAAALALVLGGCSTLPSSGPTARRIVNQTNSPANAMGIRIVEIDPANIAGFSDVAPLTPTAALGTTALAGLARPGRVDVIGPGDILQISVYEVGASLFSGGGGQSSLGDAGAAAEQTVARGGQVAGIAVDEDGAITVPYVGRLQVAGKTPIEVGRLIEAGLAGKSQSPQVVVTLRRSLASTVLVSGVARTPGRYPLTGARETLLDVVADAGGIAGGNTVGSADNPEDILVRFTRNGRTVEAPLAAIRSRSADDLVLLPRDRIDLVRRERSYTVFGAANRLNQTAFNAPSLSLAEALARAGGPNDSLADPTAVFVFRYAAGDSRESGAMPMIYRLNLMNPQGFFLSQRFQMQDKDVLYVANSASNAPTKLVSIINQLFSPVFSVVAVSNAVK